MAAVDDCITAVMTSPTATRASTPSKLDHHATLGAASTAGRSAGCSRSASPPIPCCRVVSPNRTSANPASAAPAADTRPRPSSLINAPTKIIGNAAAVSETRKPISATSHPVPVVPTFAPNTSPRPCGNVSRPALTRPMVVMVVALDDCTRSVAAPPQKAPRNGVAAALPSTVRSPEPANPFSPTVITVMPSRNRPTPPRIAIVVDIYALTNDRTGVHCSAASTRSQEQTSSSRDPDGRHPHVPGLHAEMSKIVAGAISRARAGGRDHPVLTPPSEARASGYSELK